MPMPQQTPWASLMAQQAQSLAPRTEADGSTPEEQMASQMSEPLTVDQEQAQEMLAQGMNPMTPVQIAPKRGQSTSVKQEVSMPMRTPDSVAHDQRAQEMVDQASGQARDAYLAQQQGLSQLEDNINEAKKMPTGFDYTGAASMAKFLNPENDFTKEAAQMKPETPQQKAERILKLQDLLQQRKEGLSKISDAQLSALLKAQTQNSDMATQMKLSTIQKNNALADSFSMRPKMQNNQIDERAHQNILNKLEQDPTLKARLNSIQTLDNSGKLIADAPNLTPELFQEYQGAVIQALQKGNTGVAERAEKYMHSAGISGQKIQQFLTGQPVDIGKDSALVKTIQGFAKQERGNLKKQYDDVLEAVSSGQSHIYSRRPDLKSDLEQALQVRKNLVSPDKGGETSDDLGKMSNEELQAYIKSHGG